MYYNLIVQLNNEGNLMSQKICKVEWKTFPLPIIQKLSLNYLLFGIPSQLEVLNSNNTLLQIQWCSF